MTDTPAYPERRRVSLVSVLTALVGVGLLTFTIRQVGWSNVVSGIASVGWAFLLVLALGTVRMAVRARAWMVCAEEPGGPARRSLGEGRSRESGVGSRTLPFNAAFGAMLGADALGNLTPLGLLASEPAKVMMARSSISTVNSVASVTIENACYTASVVLVLLTGTWFFIQRADVPRVLEQAAEVVVVGALVAGVVGLWAARTRPAILSRLGPFITKLVGKATTSAEMLREVETRIYDVLQWPVTRLARVTLWEAVFHVAAVLEVWIVLRLLPGSEHATVVDAFLMETAGRFVTVAFKFIPFRLGVDEAGSGAVSQVLGFGPITGVTLALIRRLRILCLNAAGLVVLSRR